MRPYIVLKVLTVVKFRNKSTALLIRTKLRKLVLTRVRNSCFTD